MCGALRWPGHVRRMSDNDCEESVKGKRIIKWMNIGELVGIGEGVLEQR